MEDGPNRTSMGQEAERALSEETVPLALQYTTFLFIVWIFPDFHIFLSSDLTLSRPRAVVGQSFAESKGPKHSGLPLNLTSVHTLSLALSFSISPSLFFKVIWNQMMNAQ